MEDSRSHTCWEVVCLRWKPPFTRADLGLPRGLGGPGDVQVNPVQPALGGQLCFLVSGISRHKWPGFGNSFDIVSFLLFMGVDPFR